MLHLPDIIRDLGIILAAGAVVTLLCKALRQPVVLGYLIAGFLVSRHVPFFPTVRDEASVKIWAEAGVIFLLFGLGLEFSFKKLVQVGKSASITALFEIGFMLGLGYLVGQLFGWSSMDSLFLGGILSVSSTTIIVRAFGELGLRGRKFVSLVFGVLIVEDLVAILLLVLLSTIAATKTLEGAALLASGLKLGFFLVLWFVVGIYAVPLFLRKIRRHLTDETALVVSLALCLVMVIIATNVGFSPALGAFVMGSILAETSEGKRIEHLIGPVKDLFGAVFFVSVGMLIDPSVISSHFGTIVLVTLVTIFGKLISTTGGALLAGESLKTSVQTGMSLAQIGEFSFIIATLGLSLGVTSDFLYPVAVSASAVTTFTTPYLIKFSDPIYERLLKILPPLLVKKLNSYQSAMAGSSGSNIFKSLWRAYGPKIFINAILVLAIGLGGKELFFQFAGASIENIWLIAGVVFALLLLASPFLWAVLFEKKNAARERSLSAVAGLSVGVNFIRALLGLGLAAFLVAQFHQGWLFSFGILAIFLSSLLLWNRFAVGLYSAVEDRFIFNLHESEEKDRPLLAPWDALLAEFVVSPDSELATTTLEHSKLKERFGVTIGMIERGKRKILAPGRSDQILPYDRLFLIGTDEQLMAVRPVIEKVVEEEARQDSYGLDAVVLSANSSYIGKAIRDCGLREDVRGLIVGIEREGQRILNPDSTLELKLGDVVWMVGDRARIAGLKSVQT